MSDLELIQCASRTQAVLHEMLEEVLSLPRIVDQSAANFSNALHSQAQSCCREADQ